MIKKCILAFLVALLSVVQSMAEITPYSESYNSNSTTDGWSTSIENRFTPTIMSEGDNYFFSVAQDQRSNNGCIVTSTILSGKVSPGDNYTLSFDMKLGNSGGGTYAQSPVSFVIYDESNSDIVFSLTAKGVATTISDSPAWIINDSEKEVLLPNSGYSYSDVSQITWCSYVINVYQGLTLVTIINKETGDTIMERSLVASSREGGLGNIVFTTKRYRANLAIDNIELRELRNNDVQNITPTSYTIRYYDENNLKIKDDEICLSYEGAAVSATNKQKLPILYNDKKYVYKSGDETITLTSNASTNVITLIYREAPKYSYTVNATDLSGNILKNIVKATGFEGDRIDIPYPTYVVCEGRLWSRYVAYRQYWESFVLSENNQTFDIPYNSTYIEDVVFYTEAEDVEGMTVYNEGNSEIRSSNGAMAYAEKDVKFTTLTPGEYTLTTVLYSPTSNSSSMTFVIGDYEFTHTASSSNYSRRTFDSFILENPTDVILKQGGSNNLGIDLVYITGTGEAIEFHESSTTISLPEDINIANYAQMLLEMTNMETGQRMHYVITDRKQYTFANIPSNTTWKVTIRNNRGDVFGQIDNLFVGEHGSSATFTNLSIPQSVNISIKGGTQADRTITNLEEQVKVTWTDKEGNYLAQGTSVSGLLAGTVLNYSVQLSQELTMVYQVPSKTEYTVIDGENNIVCQLDTIKQVVISGIVKDSITGLPISGVTISASQTFGGKFIKTIIGSTDNNGKYSLTLKAVETQLTFAYNDYISHTVELNDSLLNSSTTYTVADVTLRSITGAIINYSFIYTSNANEGEEAEQQNFYSDYANVDFSIYNKTKDCMITEFNVQYPQIVLLDSVSVGDVLVLTANSKKQAFMPIKVEAVISEEQTSEVALHILELGSLHVELQQTGNENVVASLYDSGNKLVKTYGYRNMELTINNLADGTYTLVSMGSSKFYNSIYDLSQMPNTGLVENEDYVQHQFSIKSGQITQINIESVPKFDESKFYYTGENTSFSINKSSIVIGNYLTLTGRIDFKPEYVGNVKNVQLIVDIPDSCQFVENSVIVASTSNSYILNDQRLTIPLERYTERVRFCIIPTISGDYAPSAFVQFELNGETIMQPIGSANYTAKDLSISVPSTVAKTTIPVSGTAIGKSRIEIYDNGVLIGQTTSLANGTWATTCELNEPYNMSMHTIYAKIKTKTGMELISETTEVSYNINIIEPEKVTMLYYNPEYVGQYNIVFDLINGTVMPSSYYFFPYKSWPNWVGSGTEPKDFTFIADLTNNDTIVISEVTIRVYTDKGNWRNLEAKYDTSINKWMAISSFDSYELPVGVDVVINAKTEIIVDRNKIDEDLSINNSLFSEVSESMNKVNELLSTDIYEGTSEKYIMLENYLNSEKYDATEVNNWIKSIMNYQNSNDPISDEMAEELTKLYQKDLEEFVYKLKNSQDSSIYALLFLPDNIDFLTPTSENASFEFEGYKYEQKKWQPTSIDDLLSEGFSYINLTNDTQIYFKYESSGFRIIDVEKAIEYSMMQVNQNDTKRILRIPHRVSHAGFKECVSGWSELVADLAKYKNAEWNLDLKNVLSNAGLICGTIKDIINASSCFYRGYFLEFTTRLENGYKLLIKDIDNKINARRKLIDKHWERIMIHNNVISQQEDLIGKYQTIIDDLYDQAFKTSDPKILKELEIEIDLNETKKKISNNEIICRKKFISDINKNEINLIEKQINVLIDERVGVEEGFRIAKKAVSKIPSTLSKGKKVSVGNKLGKLVGPLGILCDVIDIYVTGWEAYDEIQDWIVLGNEMLSKLPCEGDPKNAVLLSMEILKDFVDAITTYVKILEAKAGATVLNAVDVPVYTPHWWIANGLNVYAEWVNLYLSNECRSSWGKYHLKISDLKCMKENCPRCGKNPCECKDKCPRCGNKPCTCSDQCPKCGKNPCLCKPPYPQIVPMKDPSGYVYEGVFSNRLQGVTATAYYKENVEDMYGDQHENIVKWDAAEYAQENPLFTDENGFYRWDVPNGLWQVKFEKEGYETTYSEWLPVPPPQLDVNIAMKQARQPEVKVARAFEDAVEVEFDKYMMPELLTAENIMVMQNGNTVDGSIQLLNEEVTAEGETDTFASKVRFNAAQPFTEQEITLIVNNRVKSYAGIRMQDNYEQTFTIEQEIKQIVCDSLATVGYGKTAKVVVSVLPVAASKDKTLTVKSSSPMILGVEAEQVTIGNDGKAEITISGELPGTAALTFSVEGTDKTGLTIVGVEPMVYKNVATPIASIASGSIVEKGTAITLSCATEGAIIYYTTDGSCPCDETGSRKVYDGTPIVINESMTIKVMATSTNMYDSDVAEFIYVVDNDSGIEELANSTMVQLWPLPVRNMLNVSAGGKSIKSVTVSSINGIQVAVSNSVATTVTLDMSSIEAGIYIVNITTVDGACSRKILKVE